MIWCQDSILAPYQNVGTEFNSAPFKTEVQMETEVYYPKLYDIIYRSGYVIGFIGTALFVFSYIFLNNVSSGIIFFYIAFFMFYAGSLVSSLFLLVWKKEIKIFILACVTLGIISGIIYIFVENPEILVISAGLVLAGLSGLYGKEAHCFHFFEGWILMWSFPLIVFSNILIYGLNAQSNETIHFIFSAVYIIIAFMSLSFLIKKLKQPLMQFCQN